MFTDAQLLYLTEVLGTDPGAYRSTDVSTEAEVAPPVPLVVWTPALGADTRALLVKILASVGIRDFAHVEGAEPGPCRHLLRFDGTSVGRTPAEGGGVCWTFHALDTMLGASPEVTTRKREVWALLQEFRREA